MPAPLRIQSLFRYPVKGCRGEELQSAVLGPRGIEGDRHWLIVTSDGTFLTQRELPRMALISPQLCSSGLSLSAPGCLSVEIGPAPKGQRLRARVWTNVCDVVDQGETAARWLSRYLGVVCRLVIMADGFVRPVNPEFGRPDDQVSFADGYPLMATTTASLDDLNGRLDSPLPMNRFRPSLVIEGSEPWAEDDWQRLEVLPNGLTFRVVKPCARCVVTTTDQANGVREGEEPLKTLNRFRRQELPGKPGGVMFGQNLIHDWTSSRRLALHVGDRLQVGAPLSI
jgi:uncharacterized protein